MGRERKKVEVKVDKNGVMQRKCTACDIFLSKECFGLRNDGRFKSICKICLVKAEQDRRNNNIEKAKEKERASAAKYREKNKNTIKEKYEFCKKDPEWVEKRDAYHKQRYLTNREEFLKEASIYREDHREEIRAYDRELNRKNKEKKAQRRKERLEKDKVHKLRTIIKWRFKKIIKAQTSVTATVEFLGCTLEALKSHLESKFYPNPKTGEIMSWENHSQKGWHIDHIIPVASIKSENDVEQIKIVCNYTNLQPLWAEENHKKGAKIGVEYNNNSPHDKKSSGIKKGE